jgi:Secretion system C-terminal sorting domain/SdrD B-like domain
MRKKLPFFLVIFLIASQLSAIAQISGIVFRDYNGNGLKSTLEPGAGGIIIKAYNSADILLISTTSNTQGDYSIPVTVGTAVRLEFVIPTSGSCSSLASLDFSALSGAAYGSSVQFVTAPVTNINYAINFPSDYTGNITTQVPQVYTTTYVNGDPLPIGAGTKKAVHRISYDIPNASTTTTTSVATAHTVGSVWGVSASTSANRLFVASVLRRHAGYGPLGSGGIYMIDPSGVDLVTNFIDLDALGFPTRGASVYSPLISGTVVTFTPEVGSNTDRGLPATNLPSRDIAAFEQIGKIGLGDIDISEDGRYLYVVNLFDKKLYEIDLQNARIPVTPTSTNIRSWVIPNPACSGGENRPWAIKVYRGKIYVGTVCDAQVSQLASDLKATIYEFNPSGTGNFISAVLSFPLNYTKGVSLGSQTGWYPWTNDFSKLPYFGGSNTTYPQPILSDIEVDDDGSFILGFLDRAGMQTGVDNYSVDVSDNTLYSGYNGGDILRAYKNPTTCSWELEANGKEGASSSKAATIGTNNNEGPAGGEFYVGDNENPGSNNVNETSQGGLCLLRGSGEVILTVQDPLLGANLYGIKWLDNVTGTVKKEYGNLYNSTIGTFGKAASMGDIELLLPTAPIEIGNRVWLDANSNGIQDANETGINGVELELFVDNNNDAIPYGAAIGAVMTNVKGEWYFNNNNITGDADPNTTGIQTKISPNIHYLIRLATGSWTGGNGVGSLLNLELTAFKIVGNGEINFSDNDATSVGLMPQIAIMIPIDGKTDHNVDFGFKPTIVLPIKIESFIALPKGSQVNLQWTVSEQLNVAGYEVLFSTDGRTFTTTIATVAANTNSNATYDAVHTTPAASINYYRIKSIDKDGTVSYSDIRKVTFGKGGTVSVYPNPAVDVVNIILTGNMVNKAATVSILSMDGKLQNQQRITNTNQTETIDVSKLSNGSYILRVVTSDEVINKIVQLIK